MRLECEINYGRALAMLLVCGFTSVTATVFIDICALHSPALELLFYRRKRIVYQVSESVGTKSTITILEFNLSMVEPHRGHLDLA